MNVDALLRQALDATQEHGYLICAENLVTIAIEGPMKFVCSPLRLWIPPTAILNFGTTKTTVSNAGEMPVYDSTPVTYLVGPSG